MSFVLHARLNKELKVLDAHPPDGISVYNIDDSIVKLEAKIIGPNDSPYEGGIFTLSIDIPDRYPCEPPRVKFVTPIHHVNIDDGGRICLDSLKMPPTGSWTPALNISTLLITIQQLMAYPNADDGLMAEIVDQFRTKPHEFYKEARSKTQKYATELKQTITTNDNGVPALSSDDSKKRKLPQSSVKESRLKLKS